MVTSAFVKICDKLQIQNLPCSKRAKGTTRRKKVIDHH